ncbi:MAG: UvrD-helicase domain-containing protein [Candidatus Omnitrophica bacterium]|nr:UvrD-helicase domain-containing protein [Candidatus Omnitrophota bacterium]
MEKQNQNDFNVFPEVRVVEASAGSGKTFTLARRYVQLLLHPKWNAVPLPMRHILAITFTNKASLEMKARILDFLKSMALGLFSDEEVERILSPLQLDPDVVQKKSFQLMELIIRHYNFFQVQTIDKFINSLLSGCAFKVGLTANFKIKTNIQTYLNYSLDLLIDQARTDKALRRLFELFLHNYLYLENRRGWFPKKDMLAILVSLFEQYNTYGRYFEASPFSAEDLSKHKIKILKLIQLLDEQLPEQVDKRFARSLKNFLDRSQKGFDVDGISNYFSREAIPVRKNADVSAAVDKLWSRIHQEIKLFCYHEAFSLFNPYIALGQHIMKVFYEVTQKEDIIFLSELNQRAQSLFDHDYVTVEELYYRLATRFHHYLIDEFQDTSRIQWRNLENMIEEALSSGGSLFYVGDRKQAIYSFRGGDVGLFDEIKKRFQSFNVREDFLNTNWRSEKAIVDFNNAVFSVENLRKFISCKEAYDVEKKKSHPVWMNAEDLTELDHIFSRAQQISLPRYNKGYVHCEYVDIENKEERDEYIFQRILDVLEDSKGRFALQDIAILTRNNKQIEALTCGLMEQGFRVVSDRTSNIKEHFLIRELIFFLSFLDRPDDNLSFAYFLTSQLFERATGLPSAQMHEYIFSCRQKLVSDGSGSLYQEFKQAYQDIWQTYIEPFFQNVGLYPLYEFMISIYSRYACYEKFPDSQGFLVHWLDLIKKYEEEGYDIRSFLDYVEGLLGEDLYVRMTDSDAIRIMTVHKSKGLEFPVVIIPYLGFDLQIAQGGEKQISYLVEQDDDHLKMMRHKNKYLSFSDEIYAVHARHYKKMFMAELNSAYVALTRPQKELYAFIPKRIGRSFNVATWLIPGEWYDQGAEASYPQTEISDSEILTIPFSRYCNWIDCLQDEWVPLKAVQIDENRTRGEIVHYVLSFVHNLHDQDFAAIWESVHPRLKTRYGSISDFSEYYDAVRELIQLESMHDFFYVRGATVLTENDLVDARGHVKRIDRLMVFDDRVVLVDYKRTTRGKDQQMKQIREYQDIVKEIYPDKDVLSYLLFWEEKKMEQIHG